MVHQILAINSSIEDEVGNILNHLYFHRKLILTALSMVSVHALNLRTVLFHCLESSLSEVSLTSSNLVNSSKF